MKILFKLISSIAIANKESIFLSNKNFIPFFSYSFKKTSVSPKDLKFMFSLDSFFYIH